MTEAEARTIERLRAAAGTYACGGYLAALDGLQRTEICTALIFDRLQRKMRTVETLHGEADGNWNQTFYLLYFRTLGDRQNQEAFLRLVVLPLAQAAEFFAQDEFIMERAMACRTEEDVRRLFCIEAPSYWRTHHVPGAESDESPKRIGAFKANIIGINLVAVLQFAYGSYTGSERLRDSALTLLERLPAEDNRYMRAWQAAGVRPRNAFESQALLQLATEYCAARRCAECPVGRRIAKSLAEAGEERTNR